MSSYHVTQAILPLFLSDFTTIYLLIILAQTSQYHKAPGGHVDVSSRIQAAPWVSFTILSYIKLLFSKDWAILHL